MKTFSLLAFLLVTQSAFSMSVTCFDIKIDLKNKTVSIPDWGIQDEKVKIGISEEKNITAFSERVFLISSPDEKTGWAGDYNTMVSDRLNKKVLKTECNLKD